MHTYKVITTAVTTYTYTIRATSEERAIEMLGEGNHEIVGKIYEDYDVVGLRLVSGSVPPTVAHQLTNRGA